MNKKNKFSGLLSQAIEQKANQEIDVKDNIKILPELKTLIPPLTLVEYDLLESSLLAEGCREAIVLWEKKDEFIIIDGHNRYKICQEYGIDFKFQVKEFEDLESAKEWMLVNQLGKRNLTELQKSYLRGLQYKNEKQRTYNIANLKQITEIDKMSISVEQQNTSERLGELHKVSGRTIIRDEKFALGLDTLTSEDSELKHKILNGEIKIATSSIQNLANAVGKNEEKKGILVKEFKARYLSSTDEKPKKLPITELDKKRNILISRIKQISSIEMIDKWLGEAKQVPLLAN